MDAPKVSGPAVDPIALAREVHGVAELVRHLVRDGAAAEDVAQEAWLRAIGSDRPSDASARGWLAGIARNLARRLVRSEARRARRDARPVGSDWAEPTVDLVARAETHRRVVSAVLALDEPYRTTLLQRFFEDLSPSEIAARSRIPAATVRSRLKRGLDLIRVQFDRDDDDRRRRALALLVLSPRPRSGHVPLAGGLAVKKLLAASALLLLLLVSAGITYGWKRDRAGARDDRPISGVPPVGPSSPVRGAPAAAAPLAAEDAPGPILVLGPDGAPVAGAEVDFLRLAGAGAGGSGDRERPVGIGVTDSVGRVRWPAGSPAPPGIVRASSPDFTPATALATSHDEEVVLRLGRGSTVEGVVLAVDGVPVAGADVEASILPSSHPFGTTVGVVGTWIRRATTASDGVFRLRGLPAAIDGVVRVGADGFVPSTVQWTPGRAGALRVVIHRAHRATVRVTDRTGHALPGASVVAFRGPALRGTSEMTRSDVLEFRDIGDGTYVRDDLPAGWYWVLAARSGYRTAVTERAGFQGGVPPVDVVLDAAPGLRGRVVDAATGLAIPGARVLAAPARPGARSRSSGEEAAYLVAVRSADGPFVATSAGDGGFELTVAGPGDDLILGVEAEGYAPYVATRRGIEVGDLREIALRATAAYEFSGRVVDRDGVPVPGAVVRGERDVATAGRDGRFRLATRQQGCWITVLAPGFTSPMARGPDPGGEPSTAPVSVDFGEVVVTRLVPTRGLVVDRNGDPLAGAAVFASPAEDLGLPAGDRFAGCHGTSDEEGRVSLGLTGGDVYRVRAYGASREGEAEVEGGAAEEFRLVLGPPADGDLGVVRGRLRWEDGTWEPALVPVVVRSDERRTRTLLLSTALPDGSFEIPNVPSGPWGLRVRAAEFEGDVERIDVPPGGVAEATIVCRPVTPSPPAEAATLTVRVADAPSDLVAWATRSRDPQRAGRSTPLRRTPDSVWTAPVPSLGEYAVWCADAVGLRAGVSVGAVPGAADGPTLQLVAAGRIVLPAPPKDWAERWVEVRDADGVAVFSGLEDELPVVPGEGRGLVLPPGDWTVEVSRGIGRKEPVSGRATVVAGRSSRLE